MRQERDPLEDALGETLSSPGWREVILPCLVARLERKRRDLETAALEKIERLQAEVWLLRRMVEEPHKFFRQRRGKGEED